ncbi:MAG TPA: aminoacyl--tRNA ligase-related protein [Candidatus Saccharimonadales bacterium]|nr:aminoacyl--tRNA ligase-related protein [Candidatus Saccharimonadales bacterium]
MRYSDLFTKTIKEIPADEAARNAQLLIQAGFIHKEMAGVYSYLPLGKKVLDNISQIVREEMNAIGGVEIELSILQNKDIWEKTDRWDDEKVDNWFKTKLKSGTELGISLTNEEQLANALRAFVSSYKDLPVYIYQIQKKFRNELRAKSGLMRGREFLMKDLYSFSRNQQEHDEFYEKAIEAYMKIYKRLGISGATYRTYASGGIFSKYSDEFQTLSEVGEDTIYIDEAQRIAINKEVFNDEVLGELGLSESELVEKKAVEVGNIFSLGTKYADALDVFYTDEKGNRKSIIMGSYGFGISRMMGLLAEHFADDKGLIWPEEVSPFEVYLALLERDKKTAGKAEELYHKLQEKGVAVLFDDRDVRAGEKFADADLIGLPFRVVVSEKSLKAGGVEFKKRTSKETEILTPDELVKRLTSS